jgi:hypothetical protein
VKRITGNIYEEIFSDSPKNGPFRVKVSQIPIRLRLWHIKRLAPFPQQPANSVHFRFCLFPLCEQHTDGKRREDQRANQIFPPLHTFTQKGFPAA